MCSLIEALTPEQMLELSAKEVNLPLLYNVYLFGFAWIRKLEEMTVRDPCTG